MSLGDADWKNARIDGWLIFAADFLFIGDFEEPWPLWFPFPGFPRLPRETLGLGTGVGIGTNLGKLFRASKDETINRRGVPVTQSIFIV